MGSDFRILKASGRYGSPPCMAGGVNPRYFGPLTTGPDQARDVARWRPAERKRLREARKALTSVQGTAIAHDQMKGLGELLLRHVEASGTISDLCWPINDEPDLRPLMTDLHASGTRIALPLGETRAAPLLFRIWTPETRMERRHWNIPCRRRTRRRACRMSFWRLFLGGTQVPFASGMAAATSSGHWRRCRRAPSASAAALPLRNCPRSVRNLMTFRWAPS